MIKLIYGAVIQSRETSVLNIYGKKNLTVLLHTNSIKMWLRKKVLCFLLAFCPSLITLPAQSPLPSNALGERSLQISASLKPCSTEITDVYQDGWWALKKWIFHYISGSRSNTWNRMSSFWMSEWAVIKYPRQPCSVLPLLILILQYMVLLCMQKSNEAGKGYC